MPYRDAENVQLLAEDFARADRDLGQQGLPGSLLYTGIWLLVMGTTALSDDLPVLAWSGLVLVAVPGIIRLALDLLFERLYLGHAKRWLAAYSVVVIWLAIAWGVLLAALMWYYKAAWPAMIAGFATAGIVAGGTISLNTHKRLQQAYIVILLLPPSLAGLASGDQLAFVMGMLFIADMAFLVTIGAKGQFAAKVSHELRTPLNGLMGTLGMVRQVDSVDKRERCLDIMQKSANLLLQRINEILDFS